MTKPTVAEKQAELLNLVSGFCRQKLNDDYLELADKAIQELGKFNPPPFMRGKPEIWAAAIIHALGTVNWMFDPSNPVHTKPAEINAYFGTNGSTTSQKAGIIRDNLGMQHMDDTWATGHSRDVNPLAQFVMLDDMIVPLSMLPEDIREQVRKARAEGKDVTLRSK